MLISHRKKFIYLKTVKTAGTSIESYFEKYCMPENEWFFCRKREEYQSETGIIGYRGGLPAEKLRKTRKWYNHMAAEEIRNQIGNEIWNQYFKFCTIRNPYEKVLSGFFHFVVFKKLTTDNRPVLITQFRDWVKNGEIPLIDRDKYFLDGKICVDFFIRFERLCDDLAEACKLLSIPYEPDLLPGLKTHIRPANTPVSDFYNFDTASAVNHLFEFEFEYFGYEKMFK